MNGSPTRVMTMAGEQQQKGDGDHHEKQQRKPSMNRIAIVTKVGPHDVVMGRGTPAMVHRGNIQFRRLVASRKLDYVQSIRRRKKDDIAREIVNAVKSRNGRFLRKMDSSTMIRAAAAAASDADIAKDGCVWTTVPDEEVLRKVKQALRDDVGPVPVQQDEHRPQPAAPQCLRQKRSPLEAGPPTPTMCQETVANLNVTAATDTNLRQLVADTLQEYQEQCQRRLNNNPQTSSSALDHHGCSQVKEVPASNQAQPMDVTLPTTALDIATSSTSSSSSSPRIAVNQTATKGLDILKKAANLLETGGDDTGKCYTYSCSDHR
jgi:hypothetical protein